MSHTKYAPPPCFTSVSSNLILLNRTINASSYAYRCSVKCMCQEVAALGLCPGRQESWDTHGSRETCSLNPISHRSEGRETHETPQSSGPRCLRTGGSGCHAVLFRGAPCPRGGGMLPSTVCRFALPGIDLLCLHSGVLTTR